MSSHHFIWQCSCGNVNQMDDYDIVATRHTEPFGPDYTLESVIIYCPNCGMDTRVLQRRRGMGGARFTKIACLVNGSAMSRELSEVFSDD